MPRHATHPMARIHYTIRAGSFAYAFLVLAIYGWEHGFGPLYWAALGVQFLLYPHLAYLHTQRAKDSRRAESINLFVDAAMLGVWVGALHFPLWIAYGGLFSTALNAAVVFGARSGAWSILAWSAGAAVGFALGGFEILEATSPLVTALCFVGSLGYALAVGGVTRELRHGAHESESRYRLLAENAADLIAIVDRDARWLYTSPSFDAALAEKERAPGSDAFARAHPDDAEAAREAVARAGTTGRSLEIALRLLDGEGRTRRYKTVVRPVKGEALPASRIVLALRDVTDLHESEERLLIAAHAFEGMTEAIMITTADGTVVTVNRAFTRITGYAREDVLGQPETKFRNPMQTADFFDNAYATVHRDGYWSGTSWNQRTNGTVYREWRSLGVARAPDGRITHYIHVFYEVGSQRNGVSAVPSGGPAESPF